VLEAGTSSEALKTLAENSVDLMTLDLGLGDDNGLEVARSVRRISDLPIIIVTGRGDVIDRVVGLELGADDYIAKPFHLREVLARVRSVLRRHKRPDAIDKRPPQASNETQSGTTRHREPYSWSFDKWTLKSAEMLLESSEGQRCDLTTTEFNLLRLLVTHSGMVLSRDQIMTGLKGYEWHPTDRVIDNHVARLRRKIELDPARPLIIRTVRGVGYKLASSVKVT
jgi:DNA-binding response OmpR family regulator